LHYHHRMSSTFKRSREKVHIANNSDSANTINVNTSIGEASEAILHDFPNNINDNCNAPPKTTNQSNVPMKGTKFWTDGCTLVSTGIRELDSILLSSSNSSNISSSSTLSSTGSIGGQPIGTCICIESMDRFWSSLSDCIVRYWSAEVRCCLESEE
jgi:hypothetical protein